MFKLLTTLPDNVVVAFSGGLDSTAITDFLSNNHTVRCAFFHHGTENSERAFKHVTTFCEDRNLPLVVGKIQNQKPKEDSMEEHWRNERYEFFNGLGDEFGPVITAHHLDDCVETYIWSALHGNPKVIPLKRNNVIRPFLTTGKTEFWSWCQRKEISWCEDSSNTDDRFIRNYIRNKLMPHALRVNPGLATVVKKIVEKQLLIAV